MVGINRVSQHSDDFSEVNPNADWPLKWCLDRMTWETIFRLMESMSESTPLSGVGHKIKGGNILWAKTLDLLWPKVCRRQP